MARLLESQIVLLLQAWRLPLLFLAPLRREGSELNVSLLLAVERRPVVLVFVEDGVVISIDCCLELLNHIVEIRADDLQLVLLEKLLDQCQCL